jgi:ATP-dependent DNA helicase RecQ
MGRSGGVARVRKTNAPDSLNPADVGVFEALRAWRAGVAKDLGVPAYIVFGDATLRALAERRPGSLADLDGVAGIGAKKREAYGEAVLGVIREAA